MSCRTKTIEAMRSCQWRLFSYSHCSAASCLSPGAKKKISYARWFLNLPFHVCLFVSSVHERPDPRYFCPSFTRFSFGFFLVAPLWWAWRRWRLDLVFSSIFSRGVHSSSCPGSWYLVSLAWWQKCSFSGRQVAADEMLWQDKKTFWPFFMQYLASLLPHLLCCSGALLAISCISYLGAIAPLLLILCQVKLYFRLLKSWKTRKVLV